MNIERKNLEFSTKTFRQRCHNWNFQFVVPVLVEIFFLKKNFKERLVRNIGAERIEQVGQNCFLFVRKQKLENLVSSPCHGKIETQLCVWSGKETTIWTKSLKKNPKLFNLSQENYEKTSSTQLKVKNQWSCPFL